MNTDAPRPPADRPVGDAPTFYDEAAPFGADKYPPAPRTAGWETDWATRIAWLKSLTIIGDGSGFRPDAMSYVTSSEYQKRAETLIHDLHARVSALTATVERMERERGDAEWGEAEQRKLVKVATNELRAAESKASALTALAREAITSIRPAFDAAIVLASTVNTGLATIEARKADGWRFARVRETEERLRSRLATITGQAGSTSKDAKDG